MIVLGKCPAPKIENQTKVWNDHDKEIASEIPKHCARVYGEGYCARVIEKVGENQYKVRCFQPIEIQPYPPMRQEK